MKLVLLKVQARLQQPSHQSQADVLFWEAQPKMKVLTEQFSYQSLVDDLDLSSLHLELQRPLLRQNSAFLVAFWRRIAAAN